MACSWFALLGRAVGWAAAGVGGLVCWSRAPRAEPERGEAPGPRPPLFAPPPPPTDGLRARPMSPPPPPPMETNRDRGLCSFFVCLPKNGGEPKLVARPTWFRHRSSMGGLPAAMGAALGEAVPPPAGGGTAAPDAEAGPEGGGGDYGDGRAVSSEDDDSDASSGSSSSPSYVLGDDDSDASSGSCSSNSSTFILPGADFNVAAADGVNAVEVLRVLEELDTNGVHITPEAFVWAVVHFIGFTVSANHGLLRVAVAEYLKQRGSHRHCSTPHQIGKFINECLHIAAVHLTSCQNGCMAFPHRDQEVQMCPHCGSILFKTGSILTLTSPYSPITPCLRLMLADQDMLTSIRETIGHARQCTAAPLEQYRDFYGSATIRDLCRRKIVNSNYDILLGVAVDGYEAFQQTGAKGVVITVTVLSLPADIRSQLVCVLPVLITPGPGEPLYLDSFFLSLMTKLGFLAGGVTGVRVHGKEEPLTIRAFLAHTLTDIVGGDKVTHMTGHNGLVPGRLRLFHGVLSGTNYYFPQTDPTTTEQFFSLTMPSSNMRPRGSLRRDPEEVESMRATGRPASHVHARFRSTGTSGWSPLLNLAPETRVAFPSLSYL